MPPPFTVQTEKTNRAKLAQTMILLNTCNVSTLDTTAPAGCLEKTKAALGATNTQSGRR